MVRAFAHGVMGHRMGHKTHNPINHSKDWTIMTQFLGIVGRCSFVVRAFAHGVVGHRMGHKTHNSINHSKDWTIMTQFLGINGDSQHRGE